MRSLTAARRSAVRAWTMTSCPPPSRVCAAARPSPPAEPVMKMRATCLLLASLASSAYGASPALFGAVGIGRGQGPCRVGRNSQDLWIGVCLSCLFVTFLLIMLGRPFDELAVDECGSGPDERHEVGCVHGSPAGLG